MNWASVIRALLAFALVGLPAPARADIIFDSQALLFLTIFNDPSTFSFDGQDTLFQKIVEGSGTSGDTLSTTVTFDVTTNVSGASLTEQSDLFFSATGDFDPLANTGLTNDFSVTATGAVAPPSFGIDVEATADGRGGYQLLYASPDFYTLGSLGGFEALTFNALGSALDVSNFALYFEIFGDWSNEALAPGSHQFDESTLAGWTIVENFLFHPLDIGDPSLGGSTIFWAYTKDFQGLPENFSFTLIGNELRSEVPEPAVGLLVGLGLAAAWRRRRQSGSSQTRRMTGTPRAGVSGNDVAPRAHLKNPSPMSVL